MTANNIKVEQQGRHVRVSHQNSTNINVTLPKNNSTSVSLPRQSSGKQASSTKKSPLKSNSESTKITEIPCEVATQTIGMPVPETSTTEIPAESSP
ncbi:hypothetical protein Pmani_018896 [Petrolisthes manimaculis]|uniref:Uncharacterized protein n=1 Tax=Petrolisthes manimaculis TaxID=1843537 RepID=A0AAE1PLT7_9EUCA|nr:hypothetical protein Pmani_018896 [Petrolisthes manimaculis]